MLLAPAAHAADFYVDPQSGSMGGNGSAAYPWSTIEEVIAAGLIETREYDGAYSDEAVLVPKNPGAPIRANDRILLRNGYHGEINISEAFNSLPVTIAADHGHVPRVKRIRLTSGANWIFRGLSVSPSHSPVYEQHPMISIDDSNSGGPGHDNIVEDCVAFSVPDASVWDANDWVNLSGHGISIGSKRTTVRRNHFKNVDMGINVSFGGMNSLVEDNLVENFSGDGIRGLANYVVYQGNYITNSYDVDSNHDDGFQSWSRADGDSGAVGEGEVVGVVLRANVFRTYEDPDQPYRSTMQGIGCFDGFFVDWVVENNVIINDHWHGISFYGAQNVHIVNNTLIDIRDGSPGPPGIHVVEHKDGRLSSDNVVRNNLTPRIIIDDGPNNVADHNIEYDDAEDHFVDASIFYLTLKSDSSAIDNGSDVLAPSHDCDGVDRPQGSGIDIGAFEYYEGEEPVPPSPTPTPTPNPTQSETTVKVQLKFNKPSKDKIGVKLKNWALPEDFVLPTDMTVNVCGAEFTGALDAKGKFKSPDKRDSIKMTEKKGHWKLTVKRKKSEFAAALANCGLTDADNPKPGVPVTVPLTIEMGGATYSWDVSLRYRSKPGKKGTAK